MRLLLFIAGIVLCLSGHPIFGVICIVVLQVVGMVGGIVLVIYGHWIIGAFLIIMSLK